MARKKFHTNVNILSIISSEGDIMPPHFFKNGENHQEGGLPPNSEDCSEAMNGNCGSWEAIHLSAGCLTSHLVQNWLSDNMDWMHFGARNSGLPIVQIKTH